MSQLYKEALMVVKCKLNEDKTNAVLDLPFKYYHAEVVHKGRNYGPYPLPKELDGQEVLALVTYSTQAKLVHDPIKNEFVETVPNSTLDVESVKASIVEDFQKDARVDVHWTLTKETALATTDKVGDVDVVTPYDGADKLEKYPIYPASATFVKAVAVEEPIEEPKEEPIDEVIPK